MKILLKLQPYSQLDPNLDIPIAEQRLMCATVSMKMIISYHFPESETAELTPQQLKQKMIIHGGKNEEGYWKHSAEVDVLKEFGLVSWRRNWHAPSKGQNQDLEYFMEQEGYDGAQLAKLQKQWEYEQGIDNLKDKASICLQKELLAENPVIISVRAGFSTNRDSHQLVLNGYEKDEAGEYYYVLDPDTVVGDDLQNRVSAEYFFSYFNYFAVFASKQSPIA